MVECKECEYNHNFYECRKCDHFIPKIGCQDGKKKKPTNGDRIRSMTDEELAEKLGSFRCPQKWCFPDDGKNCKSCWLEWLRQEVTDEHP